MCIKNCRPAKIISLHPNNVDGELAPVALVEVSIINYNIAAKDIVMYPNKCSWRGAGGASGGNFDLTVMPICQRLLETNFPLGNDCARFA